MHMEMDANIVVETLSRTDAIKIIEDLYPADSPLMSTATTGRRLLEQAQREVTDWRQEPTAVLMRYAALCCEEDQRQCRAAERNRARRFW